MTEDGVSEAVRMLEAEGREQDPVLVVYLPDCHESIAGIIAGRLKEKYHKPVLVATRAEEGIKGSGRSIEAYSMYEELVRCADLLIQFGGHPMAAGLSIEEKNIEKFRRRLNQNCSLTEEDLQPKIVIDVPMPISYITKNLIRQIALLEPFGKGNTKPLFAQKGLKVLDAVVVGRNRNVAKVRLMDPQGTVMDGVYFGEADEFVRFIKDRSSVSVTYYPEINQFRGREDIQIVIQNYC